MISSSKKVLRNEEKVQKRIRSGAGKSSDVAVWKGPTRHDSTMPDRWMSIGRMWRVVDVGA